MTRIAHSASVGKSSGQKLTTYDYRDETGALLFQAVRQEPGRDGQKKSFYQRRPDGNGGWINDLKGVRLVLYRLPEILKQDLKRIIFVVEGEKCAGALWDIDAAATTNPQGAGKWREEYSQHLRGRNVVILSDNDEPGRKHADSVAKSLRGIAVSAVILELPGLAAKGDVADWLAAGGDNAQLMKLALTALQEQIAATEDAEPDEDEEKEDNKGRKEKISDQLIKLVLSAGVQLFRTLDGTAYGVVPKDGHNMTLRLRNSQFESWLLWRYYLSTNGKTPGKQAVPDAIGVLEGIARYDRPEETVHLRVAETNGKLYIDLCDPTWRAVEIDAGGWRIVNNPPVRFRRAHGMLPLPEPKRGGTLDQLRHLLNLASDDDWRLAVACLLAYYRPRGPYPLMVLNGQQGSAKSTTARIVRNLIDPNKSTIRCEPKEARDLAIAANAGWLLAYDNLSSVPVWLSDALCRLSTGGGFSTRQLYTDDEEIIFDAQRPVILTSIEDVATRGDLLERSLILSLPSIPEAQRQCESELWSNLDKKCPYIFGALLDALAGALRELPEVRLTKMPRMADFAVWATACERALGWPAGSFLRAYENNRVDANAVVLDSSPLTAPLQQLVANAPAWIGTASQLLETLAGIAGDQAARGKDWPKNARALGGKLKRLAPNLEAGGISIQFSRNESARTISIVRPEKVRDFASSASFASFSPPAQENKAFSHDANHDANDADDANGPMDDASMTQTSAQKPPENKRNDANDADDAKSRTSSPGYLAPGLTPEDAKTPFDD